MEEHTIPPSVSIDVLDSLCYQHSSPHGFAKPERTDRLTVRQYRVRLSTAVAVISLIQHWDEFFLPLGYLNTPTLFPLSLGLRQFQNALLGEGLSMFHLLMAGATVATIPPITLFVVAQRCVVQGVLMSGIKA
jgi:hypothetical protein